MSHSVTVTRTTTSTTTSTSYIVLNTGYLKTFSGLLKFFELLIGAVIVGIFGYFHPYGASNFFAAKAELFSFLMATTFMIGTFCLLLSCLVSLNTGAIISKTIFEVIYHSVATILVFAAFLNLIIALTNQRYRNYKQYDCYIAASVLGLINSLLYAVSTFIAHRQYGKF